MLSLARCVFMLVVEVALSQSVVFQPQWMHWISQSSSSCWLCLGCHCLPGRGLVRNWFQNHLCSGLMRGLMCGLYGRMASRRLPELPSGTDSEVVGRLRCSLLADVTARNLNIALVADIDKRCHAGKRRTVSYTHLTLPTNGQECRSRWSPYH